VCASAGRAALSVRSHPSAERITSSTPIVVAGLRLSEEFQFGRRIEALLSPLIAGLRAVGPGVIRVVDVGCGLGYVPRSLAAASRLGPDVWLVGLDVNLVLVHRARDLAAQEGLACRFICGDAFRPQAAIEDAAARSSSPVA
jgi:SAM-dependent methyltransferase